MERALKCKLLGYLLLSAISFSYLILLPQASVSVLIFVLIQFVCLLALAPRKKPLLIFIPLFILAANSLISANRMWQIPNLVIALLLYSVMALWMTGGLSVKGPLLQFFLDIGIRIVDAFSRFPVPIQWGADAPKEHKPQLMRVLLGIGISLPILLGLVIVLSMADEIFAQTVLRAIDSLSLLARPEDAARLTIGLAVGFYLFGVLHTVYFVRRREPEEEELVFAKSEWEGVCMVVNIVLVSVLLVYTLFVAIQFRYLFAPSDRLPYGLNFVEYARRGFFELLALTGVNILFILLAVWLIKTRAGQGAKLTKGLCFYLCAVTVVLLVSSFYRMWLYSSDDGLTRLRFLVFGFLLFEALGLLITFFYIAKPNFNIVAVYTVIALSYYLLLNLVPMDRVIARNQIDRYFETGRGGISYTLSLSPDAAPEIVRLLESENEETRLLAQSYFERQRLASDADWRQWNLSRNRAQDLGSRVK